MIKDKRAELAMKFDEAKIHSKEKDILDSITEFFESFGINFEEDNSGEGTITMKWSRFKNK